MGNVFGLAKGNMDFKRREIRFTLNKVPKPMVIPISNKLSQVFIQMPWPLNDDGVLSRCRNKRTGKPSTKVWQATCKYIECEGSQRRLGGFAPNFLGRVMCFCRAVIQFVNDYL